VPDVSNMLWHFSETLPRLDAALLFNKLSAAVSKQFFNLRSSPFYVFTNLAVLCLPLLLFRWRRYRDWVLPLVLCFGLYAAMIVLQQNHARFQQIIVVPVFVVLAVAILEMRHRLQARWVVAITITLTTLLCGTTSAIFAHHLHQDSEQEAAGIEEFKKLTRVIGEHERIATIGVWRHGPMANLLRPRPYLTIRPNHLSENSVQEALELFKPSVLITQNYSVKSQFPEAELLFSTTASLFGPISVYRIVP